MSRSFSANLYQNSFETSYVKDKSHLWDNTNVIINYKNCLYEKIICKLDKMKLKKYKIIDNLLKYVVKNGIIIFKIGKIIIF